MSPSSIDSASIPNNSKITNLLILLIFSPLLRYTAVQSRIVECTQAYWLACTGLHSEAHKAEEFNGRSCVHNCTHTRTQREFNGLAIIETRKFIQVWRRLPYSGMQGIPFKDCLLCLLNFDTRNKERLQHASVN